MLISCSSDKNAELETLTAVKDSLEVRIRSKDSSLEQWKEDCAKLQVVLAEKDKELSAKLKEMAERENSMEIKLQARDHVLKELTTKISQLERDISRHKDKIRMLMLRSSRK